MEETVTIQQVEVKNISTGPMWTAITSAGKMSCFDKDLADKLFALVGKTIVVEVEKKGIYKNLKDIVDKTAVQTPTPASQITDKTQIKIANASYCLSYAKDLCVAGKVDYKDLKACALNLLSIYEEMIK